MEFKTTPETMAEAERWADNILLNHIPEGVTCDNCGVFCSYPEEKVDMKRIQQTIAAALQSRDDEIARLKAEKHESEMQYMSAVGQIQTALEECDQLREEIARLKASNDRLHEIREEMAKNYNLLRAESDQLRALADELAEALEVFALPMLAAVVRDFDVGRPAHYKCTEALAKHKESRK